MPVFKNITNSELLLPKEDGLKPSLSVKPATKFNGSEAFYGRYVIDKLVERQTDGWTFVGTVGTGPDVAAFVPDGSIIPNRIVASAADAALNDQVSAGTSYSAFGAFRWNVSGTTYTVFFSIQGDGTHGSGSTFAFGSPDSPPVAVPTVTGSKVNCAAGTITVAMTGACTSPQIDLVYEPRFAGFRIGEDNPLLTRPNFIVKTVYVVADDLTAEPTHFVAGSTGAVKTEKTFSAGAKVGDGARCVSYYYEDVANATKPTTKFDLLDVVTAADLA